MKDHILAKELQELETHYSGGFEFVSPPRASALDPVSAPQSVFDGHRFQPRGTCKNRAHDYAKRYEEALKNFDRNENIVIVELGILRGVGLAIWCDIFPNATVIGLEVDLRHWNKNLGTLAERGAFRRNAPEVCQYDELTTTPATDINAILKGRKIDVFIDDALHYNQAILKAFADFEAHMAPNGVYLIEDNYTVGLALAAHYQGDESLKIEQQQELTVITGF